MRSRRRLPRQRQPLRRRRARPADQPSTPAAALVARSAQGRVERRVPMTRLRASVAERLLDASRNTAMLTTFNEVDMQPVMDLRAKYKEHFEKRHNGTRLGFMGFFVRASVEALKRFPVVNASIDGNDVVYHGYQDIGVAVSSDRGLVVPVLRDADAMSLADIEAKIREYGRTRADGKLTIEDMTGGTFTITNGGVFGSLLSTPILNPPQTGYPRHAQDPGPPGGGERPGRDPPDDVSRALLRSPPDRRQGRGAVPGGDQGHDRGSGANPAGSVGAA